MALESSMLLREPGGEMELDARLIPLLEAKGIDTEELLFSALHPSLENLLHPGEMPGMDEAVKTILRAAGRGESILVWGHDDADGTTAVALLLRVMDILGAKSAYYIPSKYREGHGLSLAPLRRFREQGYATVVTVDTGVGSLDVAREAQSLGYEVIITDHHELPGEVPDDLVVVNPKLGGAYRYLAGVGVALKLAWGLLELKEKKGILDIERDYPVLLVLATLGTVADRVPLFSENRAIVQAGTRLFAKLSFPFTRAYEAIKGQRPSLEAVISLLSAGQQRGELHTAVELLMAEDDARAEEIVRELMADSEAWARGAEEAYSKALASVKRVKGYVLVDLDDTSPQYLSYVANRLKAKFKVPAIVLGRREDGKLVAEIRAPAGYDVMDLLAYISEYLLDWGGHRLAGGFTMEPEYAGQLAEAVEVYFRKGKAPENMGAELVIDVDDEDVEGLLRSVYKLGTLGADIRVLVVGGAGRVSSLFGLFPTSDPEGLLSIYGGDKRVKILAQAGADGFRIEDLVADE